MQRNIPIVSLHHAVQDFLSMPDGVKKNLAYSKNFNGNAYPTGNILIKEDGTVHFSYTTYKVSKGVKYFLKKNSQYGFTVDPKGRMKVWFGGKLHTIPYLYEVIKHLKQEWLEHSYLQFMTNSLMGKVIIGKITNPHDLCKAILKLYRIEGSPSILRRAIEGTFLNKTNLLEGIKVAKNLDHYLEFMMSRFGHENHHQDLIKQAVILERKIDFNWSDKRMSEEHKMWTRELMDLESDSMSKEPLDWLNIYRYFNSDKMRLLESEYDVYCEGKMMSHCVYTNYWSNIKNQAYVVFHVNDGSEYGATLGLNVGIDYKLSFNQLYSHHNMQVSPELRNDIKQWLDETNYILYNQKLGVNENIKIDQYVPVQEFAF